MPFDELERNSDLRRFSHRIRRATRAGAFLRMLCSAVSARCVAQDSSAPPSSAPTTARVLTVGPGKAYDRIEPAVTAANPGDMVLVYPQIDGRAYERVAVLVRKPRITIRSAPDPELGSRRVRLSGTGFDYSGVGAVPRAIFQFDPGADGGELADFDLSGAHNDSHNGAGVRINAANHVKLRNCDVHDNDMGVMSNGDGTPRAGLDQWIEFCRIHGNGSPAEPGQNHNLYLGGTSVVVSGCEIFGSLTGHNLKSRAHYTRVEYCWVHDSANRELDLVDAAGDTEAADSDAVVLGCVLVKARDMQGNRAVIQFGQDGGQIHRGTLHLVHNTIVTPYRGPVVDLSAADARVELTGNLICDGGAGAREQVLVTDRATEKGQSTLATRVRGSGNVLTAGFVDRFGIRSEPAAAGAIAPVFVDARGGDFRLVASLLAGLGRDKPAARTERVDFTRLPPSPGRPDDLRAAHLCRYLHPQRVMMRPDEAAPEPGATETK